MTFDNAGNMLTQEIGDGTTTVTYTYDAWNRLVKIAYNASIRSEYSYNGLNWRVLKRADTSHDGDLDQQRVMYYNESNSGGWQLLERFNFKRSNSPSLEGGGWGVGGVDASRKLCRP
jgi:YD repeat-containing protein